MRNIQRKVGDEMIGTIYRGGTAVKNTVLVNPQITYSMDGSGSLSFSCPDEIQMYDYIYTDGSYFLVTERANNTWRALWIPQLLNHIIVTDGYGFEFPFTDTYLSDILTFLNGILDRPYNKLFQKFTITMDVPNTKISTTFSKDTITTALQQIADILNCFVVYDNFNVKLTATLEQNDTVLMRGKNCVVTREYENGLIPTREFTLGGSDLLPSEYPNSTLTKSAVRGSLDISTGETTASKKKINSFTTYVPTGKRVVFPLSAQSGWLSNYNCYGIAAFREEYDADIDLSQFDFANGDYRATVYTTDGVLIKRVKVLDVIRPYTTTYIIKTEQYDEDGKSISYPYGGVVVLENHNEFYTPSHYEQDKKVSIQKFFETPITLSEWHYSKDKLISLTTNPTYPNIYTLRISYAGSTNPFPFWSFGYYGVLSTAKLDIETMFKSSTKYENVQQVDLDFAKTVNGKTLSLTLDDLEGLTLFGTYVEADYFRAANMLDSLALRSMERPLKEYDLILTGNLNFKAGQLVNFEGGQYLVQQVQKTVDRTTIKLSTKPYDVYLKQFLNIYDTQRNMQREYRRRL